MENLEKLGKLRKTTKTLEPQRTKNLPQEDFGPKRKRVPIHPAPPRLIELTLLDQLPGFPLELIGNSLLNSPFKRRGKRKQV